MDEITTTTAVAERPSQLGGMRRAAVTSMLALGLLVVGGVAAANAADPSATPTPSAQLDDNGGTDATPGTNGSQDTQDQARPGCEHRDGGAADDGTTDDGSTDAPASSADPASA